jgi:hypothetical protein
LETNFPNKTSNSGALKILQERKYRILEKAILRARKNREAFAWDKSILFKEIMI